MFQTLCIIQKFITGSIESSEFHRAGTIDIYAGMDICYGCIFDINIYRKAAKIGIRGNSSSGDPASGFLSITAETHMIQF